MERCFSEFSSPCSSFSVGHRGNFAPDLEEEVKQQPHYFYPVKVVEGPKHCGSFHQSLMIKSSPLLEWVRTWTWLSPAASSSLASVSPSSGQSPCQLYNEGCQLLLRITSFDIKVGSDKGDTSSSSPRLVLVFRLSQLSFPTACLTNPQ